jgi:hypothetical protein
MGRLEWRLADLAWRCQAPTAQAGRLKPVHSQLLLASRPGLCGVFPCC